jgi:hypothetical protein
MKKMIVYSALRPDEDHSVHFLQEFDEKNSIGLELGTHAISGCLDCNERNCDEFGVLNSEGGSGYTKNEFEIAQVYSSPERSGSLEDSDERPRDGETEYESVSETTPWRHQLSEYSLPEFYGQIVVPLNSESNDSGDVPWYRSLHAFLGLGSLIAVGYMDPGNWVTDLAGGSAYEYSLLFVIALSSIMAMFLQYLSLKAGLATSRDLAQICRDSYPRPVVVCLWIIMEVAICATGKLHGFVIY